LIEEEKKIFKSINRLSSEGKENRKTGEENSTTISIKLTD